MRHLYAKYLSAKYLSAKFLYAKFVYAKSDIYPPKFYTPNLYTPNGTFIRQMGHLSAKFIRQIFISQIYTPNAGIGSKAL
jgi:hypothetical protein